MRKARTLYIKNPAAHRLAAELSEQMGVTLTEAVIHALEDKLRRKPRPLNLDKIEAIRAKIRALPIVDPRTPDEILGYDEYGIPR